MRALLRWPRCLWLSLAVTLLGCDVVQILIESTGETATAAPAAERPAGSDLESLDEGTVTQVYYQFIDDQRRVRFVTSLELVPEAWRDRVGHVEMSLPPPMSPQDMKRAIEARATRLAARVDERKRGPEIVIYSADWCPACVKAKRYLESNGYEYEERNVDEPRYKEELIKISGGRSIPVIDVDGTILKGFSPQRLEQAISEAS